MAFLKPSSPTGMPIAPHQTYWNCPSALSSSLPSFHFHPPCTQIACTSTYIHNFQDQELWILPSKHWFQLSPIKTVHISLWIFLIYWIQWSLITTDSWWIVPFNCHESLEWYKVSSSQTWASFNGLFRDQTEIWNYPPAHDCLLLSAPPYLLSGQWSNTSRITSAAASRHFCQHLRWTSASAFAVAIKYKVGENNIRYRFVALRGFQFKNSSWRGCRCKWFSMILLLNNYDMHGQ